MGAPNDPPPSVYVGDHKNKQNRKTNTPQKTKTEKPKQKPIQKKNFQFCFGFCFFHHIIASLHQERDFLTCDHHRHHQSQIINHINQGSLESMHGDSGAGQEGKQHRRGPEVVQESQQTRAFCSAR